MKMKIANRYEYFTQTERKNIPIAAAWCLEHGETSCRVNRKGYRFDFEAGVGWVSSWITYWGQPSREKWSDFTFVIEQES